jgi:lipoate-protein ligase A
MSTPFRVIDTGVRNGRLQIAFDQAMIELHRGGLVPDTIRFLRFEPSALVGRHQALRQELKIDYCRANGVGLVRRITGGGAIYLDPGQLGWELVLSRKRLPMPTLADYTRAICEAVAHGLSRAFAVDARFRPRNDIEVGGQKLCGTGGFFDGDTLFYQGTVLIDADPARIMACLNVPEAKLKKRGLDKAEQRVTTLRALLGGKAPEVGAVHEAVLLGLTQKLGIAVERGVPSAQEEALAAKLSEEEIGTDEFVFSIDDPRGAGVHEASRTGPGGTVTAYLRLEGAAGTRRIREALLTGDFFVTPPRLVYDLEASLRGVSTSEAGAAVERFFATTKPDLLTIAPGDFRAVIEAAVNTDPP